MRPLEDQRRPPSASTSTSTFTPTGCPFLLRGRTQCPRLPGQLLPCLVFSWTGPVPPYVTGRRTSGLLRRFPGSPDRPRSDDPSSRPPSWRLTQTRRAFSSSDPVNIARTMCPCVPAANGQTPAACRLTVGASRIACYVARASSYQPRPFPSPSLSPPTPSGGFVHTRYRPPVLELGALSIDVVLVLHTRPRSPSSECRGGETLDICRVRVHRGGPAHAPHLCRRDNPPPGLPVMTDLHWAPLRRAPPETARLCSHTGRR